MNVPFHDGCVNASQSLAEAMRALDATGAEIVLVVNAKGVLVGVVTDGDIRRALLHGASLTAPVAPHMSRDFTAVGPRVGRAEVLDLMQARVIRGIPIVDDEGRVVGLHLLHEVLGAPERPNAAVVMAGGQGTRLRPLTEAIPKPMIRVAGRPILERVVLHLVGFGIRRVFIAINYLGHMIEDHFGNGRRFGCEIEYLRETQPLGTGGALSLLPEKAVGEEPLLVINGDLVTQANLGDMLDYHRHGRQRATMGVRRYFHTVPYGCVDLADDRVTRIVEKPQLSFFVNAGIYALDRDVVRRVPPNEDFPITTLLEGCLDRGEPVRAFEIEDDWIDVGQREQLKLAQGREH